VGEGFLNFILKALVFVLIPVFSIVLEYSKLAWHADALTKGSWHADAEKRFFFFMHIWAVIGLLVVSRVPWWVILLGVISVWASDALIEQKRLKTLVGNLSSLLSSWPWHVIAYYMLGWPMMLLALPTGYYAGWIWNKKRPAHWGPSFWSRLYP